MSPSKRPMVKTPPNNAGLFRRRRMCAVTGFLVLLLSLLSPVQLAAQGCFATLLASQNHPESNLSDELAIEWAKCITTQMPAPNIAQQTITLGTFEFLPDGTAHMIWNQSGGPGSVFACGAGGGGLVQINPPICLSGINSLSSFNMQYQILISKPANYDLQVVLTNPTVGGGSEDIVGTIQNSGSTASGLVANPSHLPPTASTLFQGTPLVSIVFHPHVVAQQTLKFLHSGAVLNNCLYEYDQAGQLTGPQLPCSVTIQPSFQPQLGAFVAHYLPVAVIYQPPGSKSSAGFLDQTSYGTTLCWGTSTTSGTVQTEDASAFFGTQNSDSVVNGIAQLASTVGSIAGSTPVGTAANVIGGVLSALDTAFHINHTKTTTQTEGQTVCKGADLTVTQGYDSDPVLGDRYVLLKDALFVFVVVLKDPVSGLIVPTNGIPTVILTMISSTPNAPFMSDLLNPQNAYPPDLVQQFQALDLQLNPRLLSLAISANQPQAVDLKGRGTLLRPNFMIGRLKLLTGWDPLCYAAGGKDNKIGLGLDSYTSTDVSSATITTITTKVSGFATSLFQYLGQAGETTQSFTISSNHTDWQKYGTESLLDLSCPEIYPPYQSWEMSYYLDTLFGTLLAVPGPKCTSTQGCTSGNTPMIAGRVVDQNGTPVPSSMLALKMAAKTYRVFTDTGGRFAFHTPPLPKGRGAISVGNETFSVTYNGIPVSNLNLRIGSEVATAYSLGKAIGGANLGNVVSQATPCCPITSIDAAARVVTANVTGTAQSFQFAVKDPGLLKSLRIGQRVFANFKTRQVSLDGRTACCEIVSGVSGQSASVAPVPGAVPTFGPKPMLSAGTASSGKDEGKGKGKQTPQGQGATSLGGDTSQLKVDEPDSMTAFRGAAPPHPSGQKTPPCCRITAISRANGVVTAKEETTGREFQFRVMDARLLQSLAVGQGVYANFRTRQVSLDSRTACCSIVAPPGPSLR